MIRVSIDLHSARTGKKSSLGHALIYNNREQTSARRNLGSYVVKLYDRADRLYKTGTVRDFPRKRLLAWDLLCRALNNTIGERNASKKLD